MPDSIGIYFGDEQWVLKGLGEDIASAFRSQGIFDVQTTDQVLRSQIKYSIPQLNINVNNDPLLVPKTLFAYLPILIYLIFAPKFYQSARLLFLIPRSSSQWP